MNSGDRAMMRKTAAQIEAPRNPHHLGGQPKNPVIERVRDAQ